jgi:glycosyltransferase involved in cell wall biosynthesis
MKVLVVTSVYLSGHGNFVAEQVRSLQSSGIAMDVIFFDPRETRMNYAYNLPRIVRAIRSGRYDIVHTHHTYTMLLVSLAKKLAKSAIPVVLTNHEPEALDTGRRTRTWHPTSRIRHSLRLKRYAASKADFVIFVSAQLAAAISVDRPREIIPCGVDLEKFRPLDRGLCQRQLSLVTESPVIFFPPSPRNKRKRFELAREVFQIVRGRLLDGVLLTGGNIHADSMPIYYNAANVMLQTSYCEASPTVVKEALACEIPVVSTDVGDTRSIVDGIPNCWVCSEDPMELADRILEVNGQRAFGGRERLLQMGLGLEQVAKRVIQVYERVLNG